MITLLLSSVVSFFIFAIIFAIGYFLAKSFENSKYEKLAAITPPDQIDSLPKPKKIEYSKLTATSLVGGFLGLSLGLSVSAYIELSSMQAQLEENQTLVQDFKSQLKAKSKELSDLKKKEAATASAVLAQKNKQASSPSSDIESELELSSLSPEVRNAGVTWPFNLEKYKEFSNGQRLDRNSTSSQFYVNLDNKSTSANIFYFITGGDVVAASFVHPLSTAKVYLNPGCYSIKINKVDSAEVKLLKKSILGAYFENELNIFKQESWCTGPTIDENLNPAFKIGSLVSK